MPGQSPRVRSSGTKTCCTLRTASSPRRPGSRWLGVQFRLRQSGKRQASWSTFGQSKADIDPTVVQSNSFPLEWPPRSGQVRQFPEVDRAAWFDLADARSKIHKGQVALLDELNSKLGG